MSIIGHPGRSRRRNTLACRPVAGLRTRPTVPRPECQAAGQSKGRRGTVRHVSSCHLQAWLMAGCRLVPRRDVLPPKTCLLAVLSCANCRQQAMLPDSHVDLAVGYAAPRRGCSKPVCRYESRWTASLPACALLATLCRWGWRHQAARPPGPVSLGFLAGNTSLGT